MGDSTTGIGYIAIFNDARYFPEPDWLSMSFSQHGTELFSIG
jgi:hypothetical protein